MYSFTFSKKCLPISVNTISHPTQCGTVLDLCNAHEHPYSLHTNLLRFVRNMYTGDRVPWDEAEACDKNSAQ